MKSVLTAVLAVLILAAPARAGEDKLPPYEESIQKMIFISDLGAWCIQLGDGRSTYGGCLAEYQIPPDRLRHMREEAGLNPETPVWDPTQRKSVPLPNAPP